MLLKEDGDSGQEKEASEGVGGERKQGKKEEKKGWTKGKREERDREVRNE